MAITKQQFKKLEEKAKKRYVQEEIIINYCKPSGEVVRLMCMDSVAIIPSDEQENIEKIEGNGAHIFADRIAWDKYNDSDEQDKKLYEKDNFIILPEKE